MMKFDIENKIFVFFTLLIICIIVIIGYKSYSNAFEIAEYILIENLCKDFEVAITLDNDEYYEKVGIQTLNENEFDDIVVDYKKKDIEINTDSKINLNLYINEYAYIISYKNIVDDKIHYINEESLNYDPKIIEMQKNTLLLCMLAILVSVEMTILISHNITNPINKLILVIKKIIKNKRFEKIDIRRKDEIGILANSFNDLINYIDDYTNQLKRAEKLSVMGSISSELAHEIRNPLMGIKSIVFVIKNRYKDDMKSRDVESLEIVQSELSRIEDLITQLLDYTKSNINVLKLVTIEEIINSIKPNIEAKIENKKIENGKIEYIFRDNYIDELLIDSNSFIQIILNLIYNAIDACEDGGLIEIAFNKTFDNKLELIVKDNGKGIEKSKLNSIFNPFYSNKSKGTGLGLSVVEKLVLELDGKIEVQSEENIGTEFNIKFDVEEKI